MCFFKIHAILTVDNMLPPLTVAQVPLIRPIHNGGIDTGTPRFYRMPSQTNPRLHWKLNKYWMCTAVFLSKEKVWRSNGKSPYICLLFTLCD